MPSLGGPCAEPEAHPELDDAPTQLHVVAARTGGVHLLHGGQISDIGRSADADVPLDDPDVSRLHCAGHGRSRRPGLGRRPGLDEAAPRWRARARAPAQVQLRSRERCCGSASPPCG
ncbi:FHA domain-containing protein [Streptomyces sp. L7]